MNEDSVVYVGVDAAKAKHAVAVAESGRGGEVRYVGEIETTPAAVERLVRKLARKHPRLRYQPPADPCVLPKALLVVAAAKEVSHPDRVKAYKTRLGSLPDQGLNWTALCCLAPMCLLLALSAAQCHWTS